jgi:two-component system invasion response regulator UvrY
MTHVLIIDTQEITRDSLRELLHDSSDITVLASTAGYEASVAAVCEHEIDIVVIDLAEINAVMATLADLKQIRPGMRTLVLSDSVEAMFALAILQAGVDGYVNKDDSAETLRDAIRSVATGERYVCPDVGWQIAMNLLKAYPGTVLH